MKFNIYFDDGVILPTEDMKTAFKACDMPDRVAAVTAVNYNGTEEVLWGEKPAKPLLIKADTGRILIPS